MKNEFTEKGSLSSLNTILKSIKGKTIFIVLEKQSFEASGARERLKPLLQSHNVVEYSECRINPDIRNVLNGIMKFKEAAPDVVLALGGGSVIDTAKAINILAAQKEGSFEDMIMGKKKIFQKGIPFIAVPTTVGSGSESTHFATIYAKKKKYSIAHEFIKPDFVILDPELCFSLPGKIIAASIKAHTPRLGRQGFSRLERPDDCRPGQCWCRFWPTRLVHCGHFGL